MHSAFPTKNVLFAMIRGCFGLVQRGFAPQQWWMKVMGRYSAPKVTSKRDTFFRAFPVLVRASALSLSGEAAMQAAQVPTDDEAIVPTLCIGKGTA